MTAWRFRPLLIMSALCLSILLTACEKSPEDARNELTGAEYTLDTAGIFKAIRTGPPQALQLFAIGKIDLAVADPATGLTPLMLSIVEKKPEHFSVLMQALSEPPYKLDINVNMASKERKTPLMFAIESGNADMVRRLLESGANANAWDARMMRPLHYAAMSENPEMVGLVLAEIENEKQVNEQNLDGRTALMLAVEAGNVEAVKALLDADSDPNFKDTGGITPIMLAVEKGHKALIPLLVDKEAELDAHDVRGRTPLTIAIASGDAEMVKLLLEQGASLDYLRPGGKLPLYFAIDQSKEMTDVVSALLEKGADPNMTQFEKSALGLALQRGHTHIAKLLIAKGAKPDPVKDKDIVLLLIDAEMPDMAMVMIEQGANIHETSAAGVTPLERAVSKGYTDVAALLIGKGAKLDVAPASGKNLAEIAVNNNDKATLELLMKSGVEADPNILNIIAIRKGHESLVPMLLQHGAQANIRTGEGQPLLWIAANKRMLEATKALLEAGADPNARNSADNATAAMVAAVHGFDDIITLLAEHKADLDLTDKHRYTALAHAVLNARYDAVRALLKAGANPNAFNNETMTILALAEAVKKRSQYQKDISLLERIIALLVEAGAK